MSVSPGPQAISVVVPTRDRAALLDSCLAFLRKALRPQDELIVADSASRDDSVAEVARTYGATIVRCEIPGTSRARNAGWRSARHDVIAFIDDDMRVEPGWAQAMAETFARFDEVAYVTGRVGPPMSGGKYLVAQKTDEEAVWLTGAPGEVQGHAANLAVRRAALIAVRGFDESMGPGTPLRAAEDLDLMERLLSVGYRGRYEPDAAGWHESWRGTKAMFALHWAYGIGLGARIVKVVRTDRARSRAVARETLLDQGLKPVLEMIRKRALRWTMLRITQVLGVVFGVFRALPRRIVDGHFVLAGRDQGVASRSEPR